MSARRHRQALRGAAVWGNDAPRTIEDIIRDLLIDDLDWQKDALCREVDPELFFVEHGDPWSARAAIEVCDMCPVKDQCLEWRLSCAYTDDQHGIYGGMGPEKRQEIRVKRKVAAV